MAQGLGLRFDAAVDLPVTGRIDHLDLNPVQIKAMNQVIARCTRFAANESRCLAGQCIKQTAFAGVGSSRKRDTKSGAGKPPAIELFAQKRNQGHALAYAIEERFLVNELNVFLGEVQSRFHVSQKIQQIVPKNL